MTSDAGLIGATQNAVNVHYQQMPGGYDECFLPDGRPRLHWQSFLESFSSLTPTEQANRFDALNKHVRETGIAHDIFADPDDGDQHWQVGLIPLIIESAQWKWLEAAMIQRARLVNAVLADLYGRQESLISGIIPPSMIFSDSSFLRPCFGIQQNRGHVRFYAVDIARGRDGNWRVIDSHSETPAGSGFALANRVVYTHVAGDIFRGSNATRLASFFDELRADIARVARRNDPRVALLTPGPHHDDYFSHAYLARYLGYTLVEGADLRVQGNRIYLKTLEGLKPIDAIVRCVDSRQADPLELNPGGFLGPVGLVQATRRNSDLITNAIGSGLIENRGFGAALPKLSKTFLGEDLMLHDAPRQWLGDSRIRRNVLDNINNYIIRPAQEGTGRPGRAALGQNPNNLSAEQRVTLEADIQLHGATLVAEPLAQSQGFATLPSWTPNGVVAVPYALRLFVAQVGQDDYSVMPGGLAMTVSQDESVAMVAPDGRSRDVWVYKDAGPQPLHVSRWARSAEHTQIQRTSRGLQSRVADNLFWLGRYCERTDWTMRMLRSALARTTEDSIDPVNLDAVRAALDFIAAKDAQGIDVNLLDDPARQIEVIAQKLLTSGRRAFGLRSSLDHVIRVASLTRDRLSLEAWRTLNHMHRRCSWHSQVPPPTAGNALDLLEDGIQSVAAFNGLMMENMSRDYGWRFLDMGRRLERASNTAEFLQAFFAEPLEADENTSRLLLTLEMADSFFTFRSRYRIAPVLQLVLDLLLTDESNPRSMTFQLKVIQQHLEALPQASKVRLRAEEQKLSLNLLSKMRLVDVEAVTRVGKSGRHDKLIELLDEQVTGLPELTELVSRRYFSLTDEAPKRIWRRLAPRS